MEHAASAVTPLDPFRHRDNPLASWLAERDLVLAMLESGMSQLAAQLRQQNQNEIQSS